VERGEFEICLSNLLESFKRSGPQGVAQQMIVIPYGKKEKAVGGYVCGLVWNGLYQGGQPLLPPAPEFVPPCL